MADFWEQDLSTEVTAEPEFWKKDEQVSWWKTLKAIPGTVLGQTEKAVGGAIQAMGESDPLTGMGYPIADVIAGQTGEKAKAVEDKLKQGRKGSALAKEGAEVADLGDQQVKESHPGNMSYWQKAALSGTSSAISMAPAVAASIIMRNPAAMIGAGAAQAGGSSYAESRQKGIEP